MIKEQQTLSINMFINLLLVVIKITIGIVFNSYILITCGYYTLVNYIEEITSYIGSIIGMRKANMKYPFGYGRFNNILHIIVGIIFMLVGVYIFENGGDKKVYLSSADWMTRNIDYRIEVATPLLDPRLKQRVLDIIDILFSDTVKARYIDKELSNRYVPRGNRRKVRAQLAIYDYIKSLEQPE